MKHRIPRSPFATRLSGSARETEIRIRNIFQGPKKRPPVPMMLLAALLILSCGWLVSCQPEEDGPSGSSSGASSSGPSSSPVKEEILLELLYQSAAEEHAFEDSVPVQKELMATLERDGRTLGAAAFTDKFGTSLCVGVMDDRSETLTAPAFHMAWQGSVPHVVTFDRDGTSCLLYTNNGAYQGYTYGEAGLIQFDGTGITWVWPVEGDIQEEDSQARAGYDAYWEDHLALLSPGGVEIFTENKDYGPYAGSPVQWSPESSQQFYPAPEDDLPIGTLWNVRNWLEEFTRDSRNPWYASNTSALWRILSLTAGQSQAHPVTGNVLQEYQLLAVDNYGTDYFSALIRISEDSGQVTQVVDWIQGTWEEVSACGYPLRDAETVSALPLPDSQPLELMFCSGAGAWGTLLTLNPDGSFDGTYHDSDMGVSGEGFPNGTVYLCTFRGRFGDIKKLDDSTYAMTLQELNITTPHAVGEEWIEDGVRYVSSEAYGLNGGTEFLLYTPEAPISDLSQAFLTWFSGPYDRSALAEDSSLGHYGLYNKSMGYGFFS
ncbi:hypothetical protein [Pseudoflavonifractor phocaeensis]|uniref:hypothetical protein n=1 Tax=Pseudoflavonifractor phocaeensis TaxID=1870988 RepID=UPI001F3E8D8F|nr:hypothetical protein [Pseudoflavonifractor phocaeensis]MCF2662403.1 hypothetical protein [Pseudoflavonifractor phocaeensis]